jgi:endonuclease-3
VLALLKEDQGTVTWQRRYPPIDELVVTILSQHTSDLNAERAYQSLRKTFPHWEAVADAPLARVEEAIRSSGLARQKAPRIQETLRRIRALRGNLDIEFLGTLPLEEAKAWLRQLPGVGPKTAAVLLSFAMGMDALPVDTHVHRVTRRLGLIGAKVTAEKAHGLLEAQVPPKDRFAFHVYLINHGRRICKALRPMCDVCVLRAICPSSTAR